MRQGQGSVRNWDINKNNRHDHKCCCTKCYDSTAKICVRILGSGHYATQKTYLSTKLGKISSGSVLHFIWFFYPVGSKIGTKLWRNGEVLMWSIFRGSKLAIMDHKNTVAITLPVACKPRGKPLRKEVNMIPARRPVPVWIILDDDVHSLAEMSANSRNVVG